MPKKQKLIDWELSVKLANNKPELAKELLAMLIAELPTAKKNIEKNFAKQDIEKLHMDIHKLHGAACYCGIPKLKETAMQLETIIKTDSNSQLKPLIKQLLEIIDAILKERT